MLTRVACVLIQAWLTCDSQVIDELLVPFEKVYNLNASKFSANYYR